MENYVFGRLLHLLEPYYSTLGLYSDNEGKRKSREAKRFVARLPCFRDYQTFAWRGVLMVDGEQVRFIRQKAAQTAYYSVDFLAANTSKSNVSHGEPLTIRVIEWIPG